MRLWLNNLHFFGLDIRKIGICGDILVTRFWGRILTLATQEKVVLWYSFLLKCLSHDARILNSKTAI
jgi:hypothetical protein